MQLSKADVAGLLVPLSLGGLGLVAGFIVALLHTMDGRWSYMVTYCVIVGPGLWLLVMTFKQRRRVTAADTENNDTTKGKRHE